MVTQRKSVATRSPRLKRCPRVAGLGSRASATRCQKPRFRLAAELASSCHSCNCPSSVTDAAFFRENPPGEASCAPGIKRDGQAAGGGEIAGLMAGKKATSDQ